MPVKLEIDKTDVLADVLDAVRLRGRVFCRGEFSAPWALGIPASPISHFHVVERGSCWFCIDGEPPVRLEANDVMVIRRGHSYQISDNPKTPAVPFSDVIDPNHQGLHVIIRVGGGEADTDVICGAFEFLSPHAESLFDVLPRWIRVHSPDGADDEWLDTTMRLLRSETKRRDEGTATVVGRVTDIIFVQAVRAWLRGQPEGAAGWLGALRDPQIGAAIRLMHDAPSRAWTVSSLAAQVGMSRSPFAARFTTLVGTPPLAYLARWRMQLAVGMLQSGTFSNTDIAERIGYESGAAFSRGFKKQFGVAPSAFRRNHQT